MKLDGIRKKVDAIDDKMLALLARRLALANKVGFIKKELSLPIEDGLREKKIVERLKRKGRKLKLPSIFVESIFKLIIVESKKIQKKERM